MKKISKRKGSLTWKKCPWKTYITPKLTLPNNFYDSFVTVWKCLVDLYVKIKRCPKLLTFQIVCEMDWSGQRQSGQTNCRLLHYPSGQPYINSYYEQMLKQARNCGNRKDQRPYMWQHVYSKDIMIWGPLLNLLNE